MTAITEADRKRVEAIIQLTPVLKELGDELERGMAPFWEGTAESLRTIVTISGGALVASISVVQFLSEDAAAPRAGWLMATSWILFGVAIVAAMSAHAAMTGMRLNRAHASQEAMRMIVEDVGEVDGPAAVVLGILNRVEGHFNRDLKAFNTAVHVVRISFLAAFVSMIAFAVINLPF
ncbi:MAG TPA: hypothetical protein VF006_14830 [Longimicrobium sp.]